MQLDKPHVQAQDESNFIDLWLILIRYKKLMATVFLLCFAATLAIALLKPVKYFYSSSIEIGSITEQSAKGEVRRQIDNPATLLAKIKEGYSPQVQQEFRQKLAGGMPFDITIKVPKGSSLVVLEAKAAEDVGMLAQQFEQRIIELVKSDHARMFDLVKIAISNELAEAQRNLAEQQDVQKGILSKLEYNKVLMKLLEKQLAEANTQLADIVMSRESIIRRLSVSESKAMTLLMLNSELEQNRQRIAGLEERIQILVPAENDQLVKDMADTVRRQEDIQSKIEQLQVKQRNIQETRAISEPSRSLSPVGLGRFGIVLLGIFLGGMFAVFTTFVVGIIECVRKELAMYSQ